MRSTRSCCYKLASVFGAATEELAEQRGQPGRPAAGRAAEAAEVPGFAITDRAGDRHVHLRQAAHGAGPAEPRPSYWTTVTWWRPSPATRRRRNPWARPTRPSARPAGRCWIPPKRTTRCWTPIPRSAARSARCWPGAAWSSTGRPAPGKSQTIANLIATLVARGRKVLFVAEKRAAIDAVLSRLKGVGLGGMVLDIHEGTRDRLRIARDLGDTLDEAQRTAGAGPDRPAPPPGGPAAAAQPARDRAARRAQAVGADPVRGAGRAARRAGRSAHPGPAGRAGADHPGGGRPDPGRAARVRPPGWLHPAPGQHAVVRRRAAHPGPGPPGVRHRGPAQLA